MRRSARSDRAVHVVGGSPTIPALAMKSGREGGAGGGRRADRSGRMPMIGHTPQTVRPTTISSLPRRRPLTHTSSPIHPPAPTPIHAASHRILHQRIHPHTRASAGASQPLHCSLSHSHLAHPLPRLTICPRRLVPLDSTRLASPRPRFASRSGCSPLGASHACRSLHTHRSA